MLPPGRRNRDDLDDLSDVLGLAGVHAYERNQLATRSTQRVTRSTSVSVSPSQQLSYNYESVA